MKKIFFLLSAAAFLIPSFAIAEDIEKLLENFNKYVKEENYPKALEELNWVKKEVETQNSKKLEAFFADQLAGMQGQKIQANSAMGFTSIERSYKADNTGTIKISLAGGGKGGGNNPFGNIAALGQMAAMMGGQGAGNESFRLNGRTASFKTKGNKGELTVFLDSGSILTFNNGDKETLTAMAEEFNIDGLDNYLKGAA